MVVALIPTVVAVTLAVLERFPSLRFQRSRLLRRYVGSDLVYLLTGFVAGGSLALSFIAVGSDLVGSVFGLPRLSARDLPLWVTASAALVALDLGNYTAHSLLHRFGPLWEFHKVHHSIETLDWLATFRSHIVEQMLRRLVAPLLLILVGFPGDAVALAGGIFLAWAILNHANVDLKLGFLESLFVTPRLHRIHHVPGTDDRNFGTVFTVWDRLRGTLVVRDTSPDVALGVAGEMNYPQGWLRQLVEPPRRLAGARARHGRRPKPTEPARRAQSDSRQDLLIEFVCRQGPPPSHCESEDRPSSTPQSAQEGHALEARPGSIHQVPAGGHPASDESPMLRGH
jgi:sterol desaturase/sphingolipid hydroxylase (fatty acid hydroxylase superfamily)